MMNYEELKRALAGMNAWEFRGRDFLSLLNLDFDSQAQLLAIKGHLKRNKDTDQELTEYIREQEHFVQSRENDASVDLRELDMAEGFVTDLYYESTYQNAAHSMSAVGMLAPFMESMFYQCFQNLGAKYPRDKYKYPNHDRWQKKGKKFWDCHIEILENGKSKNNVTRGTAQLVQATGLDRYPLSDYENVFGALIAYRNSMFHNGMEWPVEKRTAFQKLIKKNAWPAAWFDKATTGGDPWIFYMTEVFIDCCLQLADEVLNAFAALVESLEEQTS